MVRLFSQILLKILVVFFLFSTDLRIFSGKLFPNIFADLKFS